MSQLTLIPDTAEGTVQAKKANPATMRKELEAQALVLYNAYPRKAARPVAIEAFIKALKSVEFAWLYERVQLYAKSVASKEKRFVPHPATWANQERYNDELEDDQPVCTKADLMKEKAMLEHAIQTHIANPQFYRYTGTHSFEVGQEYVALKEKLAAVKQKLVTAP